MNCKWNS